MTRRGALLAASAALALALTACHSGGDPKPNYSSVSPSSSGGSSTSPTTSPSPSVPATGPNVSPGEVAPTKPALAAEDTTTGALAFAAYYLKSLDWAFATESTMFLEPFYAPSCSTCQSRLTYLNGIFDSGKTVMGGRLAIKKQQIITNDGRQQATMAVSTAVSVSPATIVVSSGATASTDPGTPFITLTTWLIRDGSEWRIVEERYA